jgi:hypothetical protein
VNGEPIGRSFIEGKPSSGGSSIAIGGLAALVPVLAYFI